MRLLPSLPVVVRSQLNWDSKPGRDVRKAELLLLYCITEPVRGYSYLRMLSLDDGRPLEICLFYGAVETAFDRWLVPELA